MTKERTHEIMRELETCMHGITEHIALEQCGNREVLRGLFTTTRDGGGISLFETEIDEMTLGEQAKICQAEIYVSPQMTIRDECVGEMEQAFHNLNYYMPLGAFGIQYSTKMLFLRYTLLLDEAWDNGYIVGKIRELYEYLAVVLGNQYAALERIAEGRSTYEQEAAQGQLLKQE